MKEQKIGIVGGGIVGSTAAYYLAKAGIDVTLFDEETGQATKAAAGIICPWFTLRRNKAWYFLVSNGAEFYRQLISDLQADGFETDALFKENGALIIRKNQASLDRDIEQGTLKRETAPAIQEITTVATDELNDYFPLLETEHAATHVQGGARVNGEDLIKTLKAAFVKCGGKLVKERVQAIADGQVVSQKLGQTLAFDKLLLAVGAWLPNLLNPLNYHVDISPQKGQLVVLENPAWQTDDLPVIMPPGKVDIIPLDNHRITIGSTHEKDQGYDLTIVDEMIKDLIQQATAWVPELTNGKISETRSGIRGYTSDAGVLLGQVPELNRTWAVSGLGASGLTSGPYIGHQWAKLVMEGTWQIDEDLYPIEKYIQRKED